MSTHLSPGKSLQTTRLASPRSVHSKLKHNRPLIFFPRGDRNKPLWHNVACSLNSKHLVLFKFLSLSFESDFLPSAASDVCSQFAFLLERHVSILCCVSFGLFVSLYHLEQLFVFQGLACSQQILRPILTVELYDIICLWSQ